MKKSILPLLLFFSFSVSAQYLTFEQVSQSLNPKSDFITINGIALFGANGFGLIGQTMFRSDGTLNGTTPILPNTDFRFETGFLDGIYHIELGNEIFFNAYDTAHGVALWKTDGTSLGTKLVKDIHQSKDINSGGSLFFTRLNNKIIFRGHDTLYNTEPWVSDGTDSGTFLLKDINASGHSTPSNFIEFNNKVYFNAENTNGAVEIWVTDGTQNGTQKFIDIPNAFGINSSSWIFAGHVYGNKLIFESNDYLFSTDGTVGGTQLLSDTTNGLYPARLVEQDVHGYTPLYFSEMAGKLYFKGEDVAYQGAELWVTDGTKSGTKKVKDILPGNRGMVLGEIAVLDNSKLIFSASSSHLMNSNFLGYELWESDGTSAGTNFLKETDTTGVGISSSPRVEPFIADSYINYDGKLYFNALNNSTHVKHLWVTDGTPLGTYPIFDSVIEFIGMPFIFNDRLYIMAADTVPPMNPGTRGVLWQSEGDSTNTVIIKPIGDTNASVSFGLNQFNFQHAVINNSLIFPAAYGDANTELWSLTTYPLKVLSYEKDQFDFTLYPNPASTILKVKTDEQIEHLELFDMNGKQLLNTTEVQFDVSKLTNGIYILKIQTNKGAGSSTFRISR